MEACDICWVIKRKVCSLDNITTKLQEAIDEQIIPLQGIKSRLIPVLDALKQYKIDVSGPNGTQTIVNREAKAEAGISNCSRQLQEAKGEALDASEWKLVLDSIVPEHTSRSLHQKRNCEVIEAPERKKARRGRNSKSLVTSRKHLKRKTLLSNHKHFAMDSLPVAKTSMDSLYLFCRDVLTAEVSKIEVFRQRQKFKSLTAILGAIEIRIRPLVLKASQRLCLTPDANSWIDDTIKCARELVLRLKEPIAKPTLFESLILWCSSRESIEEVSDEREGRDDAAVDQKLDEVLCRAFVILDRIHRLYHSKTLDIPKGFDLKTAKFAFLGCSCHLRHDVCPLSSDIIALRDTAKRVFEEHMKWVDQEMQVQKQSVSASYHWRLFTLKHELDRVIVEKEDVIEDQQAQLYELSSKLEQTINNTTPHHSKPKYQLVH